MISITVFLEGITRGLLTIPYRFIQNTLDNIFGIIKSTQNPDIKLKFILQSLHTIRAKFNSMDVDLNIDNHVFLKFLDKLGIWRHHFILNDKVYNNHKNAILENKLGPNMWINLSFSEREIPEIYNIKNIKDINKILDIYATRCTEIFNIIKKYPEKELECNKLLNLAIYGLQDLFSVIHAVVSYGSKGL